MTTVRDELVGDGPICKGNRISIARTAFGKREPSRDTYIPTRNNTKQALKYKTPTRHR